MTFGLTDNTKDYNENLKLCEFKTAISKPQDSSAKPDDIRYQVLKKAFQINTNDTFQYFEQYLKQRYMYGTLERCSHQGHVMDLLGKISAQMECLAG